MGFQKNVLIIALVILSISIIVLAAFISRKERDKLWPPELSTCPPYFDISQNGNAIQCKALEGINIGEDISTKSPAVTFEDATGSKNTCLDFFVQNESGGKMNAEQKCDYSNKCKINWEGYCEKPGYQY
tara:strand:+ start:374 stop:760 length:387 start_codon:yes stop_codon:yes gene_type:complete